jgi:hypothetical protein
MTNAINVANFLLLRTPTLPISQMDEVRATFDRDGSILNSDTLKLPIVREALFLASERLYGMLYEPGAEKQYDPKFEMSVARYLVRMSTRCTPFGAFASVSAATVGDATYLVIGPDEEMTRSVRIDAAVPWYLRDELLAASPEHIRKGRLVINSSIWNAPDGLRYVETKWREKVRGYYMARVASTPAIQRVLDVVAAEDKGSGILFSELVGRVVQEFDSRPDAAESFILGLVESQLLVVMPIMSVTGDDVVNSMVRDLIALECNSDATTALQNALRSLEKVGTEPHANIEIYRDVCENLKKIKPDVSQASAIQVDLFRSKRRLSVSAEFISELREQICVILGILF